MTDLGICDFEEFVAEVTPQMNSLQEAASAQEILIQQVEGYLSRLKARLCTDLTALSARIEECCNGGGGAETFLALTDTPGSYAGEAGNLAAVNAGQTALEFIAPAGGGGLPDLDDNVEVASGRQWNGNDTYFKMRNFGALPNTGTKSVAHNIASNFVLVDAWGSANQAAAGNHLGINHCTTSFLSNQVWFYVDATNINVVTGSNRTSYVTSFMVLEYYYP